MDTTLAQRLRLLRGEMPQAEFAVKVGIHKSSWGRYERGIGEPTGSDLARLCSICAVSPLWLLCGEGDMRPASSAACEEETPSAFPQEASAVASSQEREAMTSPVQAGQLIPLELPQSDMASLPVTHASGADALEPPRCRQCRWLESRLEQTDRERREVAQENRQLWRENSELRERIARLEERARRDADE